MFYYCHQKGKRENNFKTISSYIRDSREEFCQITLMLVWIEEPFSAHRAGRNVMEAILAFFFSFLHFRSRGDGRRGGNFDDYEKLRYGKQSRKGNQCSVSKDRDSVRGEKRQFRNGIQF